MSKRQHIPRSVGVRVKTEEQFTISPFQMHCFTTLFSCSESEVRSITSKQGLPEYQSSSNIESKLAAESIAANRCWYFSRCNATVCSLSACLSGLRKMSRLGGSWFPPLWSFTGPGPPESTLRDLACSGSATSSKKKFSSKCGEEGKRSSETGTLRRRLLALLHRLLFGKGVVVDGFLFVVVAVAVPVLVVFVDALVVVVVEVAITVAVVSSVVAASVVSIIVLVEIVVLLFAEVDSGVELFSFVFVDCCCCCCCCS